MLFPSNEHPRVAVTEQVRLRTPMGVVALQLPEAASGHEGARRYRGASDMGESTIVEFETASVATGVCWGALEPSLPSEMAVSRTLAVVVRHAFEAFVEEPTWTMTLTELDDLLGRSGPEPGEQLDAYTWKTSDLKLAVGTRNGDALRQGAEGDGHLPNHMTDRLGFHTVSYLEEGGLEVTLPPVRPGDGLQLQFVVSWETNPDEDSRAPWFAVDVPSSEILDRLGV
jgi:hypothetical protein